MAELIEADGVGLNGSGMAQPHFPPQFGLMRGPPPPARPPFTRLPFDPRMPPPMAAPVQRPPFLPPPPGMMFPPGVPPVAAPAEEIWVENKTPEGKVYYYNARTRESAWAKPEGVKVIQQTDLGHLMSAQPSAALGAPGNPVTTDSPQNSASHLDGSPPSTAAALEPVEMPPDVITAPSAMVSAVVSPLAPVSVPTMATIVTTGPHPLPPTLGATGPTVPTFPPIMVPPFRVPMPGVPIPLPGILPGMAPPLVSMMHPPMSMLSTNTTAGPLLSEWVEFKTPEGKSYYHNSRTLETTWDRPMQLRDQESSLEKMKESSMMPDPADLMDFHDIRPQINPALLVKLELKEEEMTEEEKAAQKAKPVATTAITGTPWCVVWTGDERVFFYNPTTRLSKWDRPDDLVGLVEVDKIIQDPPHKRSLYGLRKPVTVAPPEDPEEGPEDHQEIDPSKAKKRKKEDNKESEKESAMEAELQAARERAVVPQEARMKQFRDMLLERAVSAFSTWEKELHKIVFDPRYLLLNTKERKQVFDEYVKTRAEEERREKKNKILHCREEFKKMLEEAKLSIRTTFSDFAARHAKDPRFKAIEKMKDREAIFTEFVTAMRKKDRDGTKNRVEKIKQDFFDLLLEQHVDGQQRWSKVKDRLDSDPRYKAVETPTAREELFKTFIERLSKNLSSEKQRELEKQARVEASLREREREVQRARSEQTKEIDREREQHKRDEAIQHFRALLSDMVRSSDASWSDTRRLLRKDHRWESASLLERDDKEKLFNEHVEALAKKKKELFRQLLDETSMITLTTSWKEVKKVIKEDPRCTKFSSSDRKKQREFEDFIKDKYITAKADFRTLLKETRFITYRSRKLLFDSDQHLHDIENILQNDKRYLVLNCVPDERHKLLISYIEDLDRRGPPPPPTASEPVRRSTK
ncbi:transcription elongation regulator 1-like [Denticeps clupeoides]|uniref:Transcription elongation regulator 1 n=1 Tax=Denticeps clupeoides TaxID=299321 RepID=A0AAY4CVE6_9TELE|nr:transcription elongation regulator 1-like [Denticeps clupeoides]